MTVLTCKLPASLNTRLEAAARGRRVPKSKLVREALEALLPEAPAPPPSLHDRMSGACGVIRSGRRDLASNPKHLEGLGAD
jgi:hypothetical protein